MKILVVGGAGYIGSHMVKRLLQGGAEVVTLDNLSGGYRDAVCGGAFVYGDIADTRLVNRIFSTHSFAAVMHFASYIQVGESVQEPSKYYQNNVSNTLNLLDVMVAFDVKKFIFHLQQRFLVNLNIRPLMKITPKIPSIPMDEASGWWSRRCLTTIALMASKLLVCAISMRQGRTLMGSWVSAMIRRRI